MLLPRFLGPSEFGFYSICFAMTSAYFTFLDFGLGQGIQLRVYSNPEGEKDNLKPYSLIRFWIGFIGTMTYGIVLYYTGTSSKNLIVSLCLLSILIISDQQNIFSIFLKSRNKFKLDLKIRLATSLISAATICGAAFFARNTLTVSICCLVAFMFFYFPFKTIKDKVFLKSQNKVTDIILKKLLLISVKTYVVSLFTIIFVNMDLFVANQNFSLSEIGMYSASQKVLIVAQLPVPILYGVIYQAIAKDFLMLNPIWKKKLYYIFSILVLLSISATIVLVFFCEEIGEFLFGKEFASAGVLIKNMAFGLIGFYFYPIFSLILTLLNKIKGVVISSFLLLGINYALLNYAAKCYGLEGLAAMNSVANILIACFFGVIVYIEMNAKTEHKKV